MREEFCQILSPVALFHRFTSYWRFQNGMGSSGGIFKSSIVSLDFLGHIHMSCSHDLHILTASLLRCSTVCTVP